MLTNSHHQRFETLGRIDLTKSIRTSYATPIFSNNHHLFTASILAIHTFLVYVQHPMFKSSPSFIVGCHPHPRTIPNVCHYKLTDCFLKLVGEVDVFGFETEDFEIFLRK